MQYYDIYRSIRDAFKISYIQLYPNIAAGQRNLCIAISNAKVNPTAGDIFTAQVRRKLSKRNLPS